MRATPAGMSRPELRLAWATHQAAYHACSEWHYASQLPKGKLVKIGVWEDDRFVGVVLFSRGASPFLGKKYGLGHTEVCELTRVALRDHKTPVSRILRIACRMLRSSQPGLRLIVSFADPFRGHHGGIYQAAGWIYTGQSGETIEYLVSGKWKHVKSMYVPKGYAEAAGKDAAWRHKNGVYYQLKASGRLASTPKRTMPGKHRYLFPLDEEMRELLALYRVPYPRGRPLGGETGDQPVTGSSTLTRPL